MRLLPEEGDLKPVVEETLSLIDRIHKAPGLPPVPVLYTRAMNPYARYVPGDGRPDHIQLSRFGPYPRLSLTHEIGHLLDHTLGNYGVYSSRRQTSSLISALQAMERSRAIHSLRAVADGTVTAEGGVVLRQIAYWLEPEEMWARAYAHYISLRSDNGRMQTELRTARTREVLATYRNVQWEDADFEPIAEAIDTAFWELGWR